MSRPRLIQTEFDNQLFTELLTGTIATRLYYWRADLCPCRERTGPDPRCKVCGGDGRIFTGPPMLAGEETLTRGSEREELRTPPTAVTGLTLEDGTPLDATGFSVDPRGKITWEPNTGPPRRARYRVAYSARQVIRAGVTRVKHRRELGDRVVDDADASMSVSKFLEDHATTNPAWDAAEGDVFELVDVHRRDKHHLQRGAGPTDRLKYSRAWDVRLSSIRDDELHAWEEGADYTLTGPTITWAAGRGPRAGEHYAAEYQANPLYTLWRELPQLRHQDALPLPRRYDLKAAESAPKNLLDARLAGALDFSKPGNAIWFTFL